MCCAQCTLCTLKKEIRTNELEKKNAEHKTTHKREEKTAELLFTVE